MRPGSARLATVPDGGSGINTVGLIGGVIFAVLAILIATRLR